MEIEILHLNDLQNEEHVQFGTDLVALVQANELDKLNIGPAYNLFLAEFENEQAAFKKIVKSAITDDLATADLQRDFTFRGLSDEVNSKLRHFDPNHRAAAKRLKVVFDTYGNLARKAYDKETADITKLIAALRESYTTDMETIGITNWVAQLEADNNAFSGLAFSRYSESESKSQIAMKEVRQKVDEAFRKITKRINALVEINGDADHASFILALNLRIEHYNTIMAQRMGRNSKNTPPAPAQV